MIKEPSLKDISLKANEWYAQFGWRANPFDAKTVIPETFVGYERERSQLVNYIINGGGYALIKGPVGAGKTTLCRWLENEIKKANYMSVFFEEPPLDVKLVDEKIRAILDDSITARIINRLFSTRDVQPITPDYLRGKLRNKRLIIFLDEAHLHFVDNKNSALEVSYRIKDIVDMHPNCRLIISGLSSKKMDIERILPDAIVNRISPVNRFELSMMDEITVINLIKKRISRFGGKSLAPFTDSAIIKAARVFNGAPRSLLLFLSFSVGKLILEGRTYADEPIVTHYLGEYGALRNVQSPKQQIIQSKGQQVDILDIFSPAQKQILGVLSNGPMELDKLARALDSNNEPIRTQIKRINEKCVSNGLMEAIRVNKLPGRGRGKYVYSLNDHVARLFAAE